MYYSNWNFTAAEHSSLPSVLIAQGFDLYSSLAAKGE